MFDRKHLFLGARSSLKLSFLAQKARRENFRCRPAFAMFYPFTRIFQSSQPKQAAKQFNQIQTMEYIYFLILSIQRGGYYRDLNTGLPVWLISI